MCDDTQRDEKEESKHNTQIFHVLIFVYPNTEQTPVFLSSAEGERSPTVVIARGATAM